MLPSANDTGSDNEGLSLTIETNPMPAIDMAKAESDELAPLTPIPALNDDKKASAATDGERTPTCNGGNDLNAYIASLIVENAKLAKEKADALQEAAKIQKEHAATTEKWKDAHARWTQANKLRSNLDQAYHRRVVEKDEAIAIIQPLRNKNAELLQIHADLGQESAELKGENARLVSEIQPRDSIIMKLRTEFVFLKETLDAERKQHEAVKAERDSLRKQIGAHNQTQRRDSDRERDRSRFRSRSPRRSPGSHHSQATRHDDYRNSRYKERSRGRTDYDGRDYQGYGRYVSNYDGPPSSPHRREPSRPAPRESDRLPTPCKTPDTPFVPDSKSPHEFLDMGKTKVGSNQLNPGEIPTAPRSQVLFSMRQAKKKLPSESRKRASLSKGVNQIDRYRPD
ncbi:hypothetical protein P171DRAFT_513758 [Karstenula rhodostoma CBS 690.94]|uniref:Uncharacterized protein n=1 Tax=Karstenula rhodostoma CBS 690.94 TaxID=1392251 RepID=A0A9P4PGK1_9PLEO|nr:hypothetical protein P171DRAFT_513758 [Karstenula rhodostoma CBS 690.94]